MKRLTKSYFKREIKILIKSGLTSLSAMETLINEYEMYELLIIDAHTAVMMDAL